MAKSLCQASIYSYQRLFFVTISYADDGCSIAVVPLHKFIPVLANCPQHGSIFSWYSEELSREPLDVPDPPTNKHTIYT
jgi:hypothetical protein